MLKDISSSAAALYDGGWRSADADQLRTEYDLTEEETQELCAALADLEEKTNNLYPRPRWRGFSFALHLLRVQGFYFVLLQYSHTQAFTVRFVSSIQFIPQTPQNSAQGFTVGFPEICPILPPQI